MLGFVIEMGTGAAADFGLAAVSVQGQDPPAIDFEALLKNLGQVLVFIVLFGGPILGRIFGGKEKKQAEKELENRRRRAEAMRRQVEAQKRALEEAGAGAGAGTQGGNPGAFGGVAEFGAEEEVERPWYELDENAVEGMGAESLLEREGVTGEMGEVGNFATSDVTSIHDLAPLGTLAETHFESLVSEFETQTGDSLLLKGTAAERRRRGVSRQSLRAGWRQAMVLREVLGEPVGMRRERGGDLPGLR